MAGVVQRYSKFKVWAVIRFSQAEGVTQGDIHLRLVKVDVQNVLNRKDVCVWSKIFKDGLTTLTDDAEEHRGRTTTSHTEQFCVALKVLYGKIIDPK